MTYGADFRPGMHALPRHDNVTLPPVAEYETWIVARPYQAKSARVCIPASRLRRACMMFACGTSLATTAKMLGLKYHNLLATVKKMPESLTGPALFRMLHGEVSA